MSTCSKSTSKAAIGREKLLTLTKLYGSEMGVVMRHAYLKKHSSRNTNPQTFNTTRKNAKYNNNDNDNDNNNNNNDFFFTDK